MGRHSLPAVMKQRHIFFIIFVIQCCKTHYGNMQRCITRNIMEKPVFVADDIGQLRSFSERLPLIVLPALNFDIHLPKSLYTLYFTINFLILLQFSCFNF